MKSEKAEELIHSAYYSYECEGGDVGEVCIDHDDEWCRVSNAIKAVELAESEMRESTMAEMREKAAEAFCYISTRLSAGRCIVLAKTDRSCRNDCEVFNQFIQKLNE